MSNLRNVNLHDAVGNPIESFSGALDTHDADVHREIVNRQFYQQTATTTTFSIASSAGDTQINLTSATGFAVGDYLHLEKANTHTDNPHPRITALAGTVATLDRPLDYDYAIGDEITKSLISMNVDGSVTSQSFRVKPLTGQVMHITEFGIALTHSSAGDNGLFGNLTALTNGVVIRRYDGTTSSFNTLTIWKENGDIHMDAGNISYPSRSGGGGGAYGTNSSGSIKEITGAIGYLDGTAGDYLEFLVQDDLTGLSSFKVKAHGHYEGS